MKKTIFIAAVLFVSSYSLQSCSNSTNDTSKTETDSSRNHITQNDSIGSSNMKIDNGMMQSIRGMMGKMNDMKMTGNFDIDFANMTIIHHQGAIEMSEVKIENGTNAQIKIMAQNIIKVQKSEIEQMQQFVKNYKRPEAKKENVEMHNKLGETMKTIMDKMNSMQMTGNTDKDYVMMMIPRHETAVTMAED